MPHLLWLHSSPDPVQSGELRRLGVPAAGVENERWSSTFARVPPAPDSPADVVVLPLYAAWALPLVNCASTGRILVEVDDHTAATQSQASSVLAALSNRIAGVVARGAASEAWARRVLGGDAPVWLVPDAAVRTVELAATAMRFGHWIPSPPMPEASAGLELWFAEPGDHIEPEEVAALAEAWAAASPVRLVMAPALVRAWLEQAGVAAPMAEWSPHALHSALAGAERTVFLGPETYGQARRRAVALRAGAPAPAPGAVSLETLEPAEVVARWDEVLASVLPQRRGAGERANRPVRVLVFLDLIQDLDPVLPVLDELRARPGVELRVVLTQWLQQRSPRVAVELRSRGLLYEVCERPAAVEGAAPALTGVDAVLAVAESSLSPHAAAHALFDRARQAWIPTFALQHGVENVGLHHVHGSEDAGVTADHLFVWFPSEETPDTAAPAVRPRLVHVGRALAPYPALSDLAGTFAAFDAVAAVFENLHWSRYDPAWRRRFLTDCTEFALAHPHWAVILKPHHAGIWSVKNRHLIPQWPTNLIVADPTDPFWEPFTAAALVQLADAVITTPSTVALDAVQARKPVAVAAYGLDLPAYAPLPLLQDAADWSAFLAEAGSTRDARRRAAFLARNARGDWPARRIVDHLLAAAGERRVARADKALPTSASA